MCELLGMNCNVPTDIRFSFSGLIQRGGRTGPHRDGWGIAFYEGRGCRTFHDPLPGCESKIAELVRTHMVTLGPPSPYGPKDGFARHGRQTVHFGLGSAR